MRRKTTQEITRSGGRHGIRLKPASVPRRRTSMKARITILTVGVDDLERAMKFYRDGLGLKTDGIVGQEFEHGAVAFFDLEGGLKLALWPRDSIAHDSTVPKSQP